MLVLNRKIDEQVVIGRNITVTVLEIKQGRVRLGVSAPREVSIHREEVALRIGEDRPNLQCAGSV
jgi:carbon storage regulator